MEIVDSFFSKLEKEILDECARRRKASGLYIGEPELSKEPDLFCDLYRIRSKYDKFPPSESYIYKSTLKELKEGSFTGEITHQNLESEPYHPRWKSTLSRRLKYLESKSGNTPNIHTDFIQKQRISSPLVEKLRAIKCQEITSEVIIFQRPDTPA
jgi:hypothetical protein